MREIKLADWPVRTRLLPVLSTYIEPLMVPVAKWRPLPLPPPSSYKYVPVFILIIAKRCNLSTLSGCFSFMIIPVSLLLDAFMLQLAAAAPS